MAESTAFTRFVTGVAASAAATLHYVEAALAGEDGGDEPTEGEEPKEDKVRNGLAQARQLIDTLVMFEEKTRGNLTDGEQRALQAALADLRMAYVRTDGRARKGAEP